MRNPHKKLRIPALLLAVLCCVSCLCAGLPLTVSAAYENTHVNTGNQPADLVAIARTQLGYAEGSNNYNKYSASFGSAYQPWCGHFISWCARQAGIPESVIPTTGSSTAFFSVGTYHSRSSGYKPQPGDIMLYGVYGDSYHVSIVERFDAASSTVHVLDGNWSDKVSSHSTTLSNGEVAGFVTPNYASAVTELTAFNMVTPSIIAVGSSYSISGFISSPNTITNVSVTITNEAGAECIKQTAAPNAKSYELSAMDAYIKFGSLDAGVYSYTVTATDTAQTKRWTYVFEVVSSVTMTIADVVAPAKIDVGKTFSIYGKVSCPEPLLSVSVSVYDEAGVYKTGGTAAPNTTTYDIHGVDNYVSFGRLAEGYYTMTVAARSSHGSGKWEYPFIVGNPPPREQTYTFDNAVTPSELETGSAFAVSGSITASEALTEVTLSVLDESGTAKLTAAAAAAETTYDITQLGTRLAFETLPAGSYKYVVAVKSANDSETWEYPFTVKTTVTYELTDATYPTEVSAGKSFTLKGTVTASEALTDVKLEILGENGVAVITAAAQPNATTFDIYSIDSQVKFGTLAEGSYTYKITATSRNGSKTWEYPFAVVSAVSFTLTDPVYPTAIEEGASCSISGTVTSTENLTTVSITVTDTAGNICLSASAAPNTAEFRLGTLDTQLKFGTLKTGRYMYTIFAQSASGSKTWEYSFTVGDVQQQLGDINFDGSVDVMDVTLLFAYVSGEITFTDAEKAAVGVDPIDIMAVTKLYAYISGSTPQYP